MANQYTLNVQDTASIEAWKTRAQDLNDRAQKAVNGAAQALNEFKDTAEGNVFEQVCSYSDDIITGMTSIVKGMNEILTAVNNLMDLIRAKSQELLEGVADVVSKVFG